MDNFGRENLEELLQEREPPAISIYLPTSRTTSEWEADRLRYRAAVDRARRALASDFEGSTTREMLGALEGLLDDQEFWLHQSDGLAVFRAADFSRLYRLPIAVPELVVVAPTFHTRPLLQFLQAPDRFWILALSQKEVKLWEGTSAGLRQADLGGIPSSLVEATSKYVDYEEETFHSSRGSGGRSSYHGHGPGLDSLEWEVEHFVRKVDEGLRERLGAEPGPVILAGVESEVSLLRSVSKLKTLADEAIKGNVSHWSVDRLHEAARPVVEKLAERRIESALKLWESAFGPEKTEMDLAASVRLAVAGRVRLVMTERERRIWGQVDRSTGAIEILGEDGDDPGTDAVDLLDELAELVILRGGDALMVPGDRMPTETGVATFLRGRRCGAARAVAAGQSTGGRPLVEAKACPSVSQMRMASARSPTTRRRAPSGSAAAASEPTSTAFAWPVRSASLPRSSVVSIGPLPIGGGLDRVNGTPEPNAPGTATVGPARSRRQP